MAAVPTTTHLTENISVVLCTGLAVQAVLCLLLSETESKERDFSPGKCQ